MINHKLSQIAMDAAASAAAAADDTDFIEFQGNDVSHHYDNSMRKRKLAGPAKAMQVGRFGLRAKMCSTVVAFKAGWEPSDDQC